MTGFDEHFQKSALSRHRHERRGGGALSTRLIRLDSPAHNVTDPATPELVVGLILAGGAGARWSWDGARANVAAQRRPGTLGLTPISSTGTFEVYGPSRILIVSLPYETLAARLAPDIAVPRDFGRLHDAYQDHPRARALCQRLWRAALTPGFGHDGLIDALAESLLVALAGAGDSEDVEARGLTHTERARLAARAEAIDTDVVALADAVAMPVRTFRRRFRAAYGMAPHRWLTLQRIDRAQRMLANRSLPLSHIAFDLGFSSQAHFSAAFRQTVGVSPGQWRSGPRQQ
jgi:AraC family transcriptional regulator